MRTSAPGQRRRPAPSEVTAAGESALALLETRSLSKRFGRVQALNGVDITVRAGSVLALLGDNGAGKSTLVKILSGALRPDSGEIRIDGAPLMIATPRQASEAGIETVYQDLALCDNLSVVQNLFLGRERSKGIVPFKHMMLDRPSMEREAERAFESLGASMPSLHSQVSNLSGGQRQAVAIARAVVWRRRVVLFDEPTAALGVEQTGNVHRLIRRLRDRGVGIVMISHNMADVFAVADRMTVLRRGRKIADMDPGSCTPDDVVARITGSDIAAESRH